MATLIATYLSALGSPRFINEHYVEVDELIADVLQFQGSSSGGSLLVEIKNLGLTNFLTFECTNLENRTADLKESIASASNIQTIQATSSYAAVCSSFHHWKPTKLSSVLPPSLRLDVLRWLLNTNQSFDAGKWRFGSYLVWLDAQSSPVIRFRYTLLSSLFFGSVNLSSSTSFDSESKRARLLDQSN